MFKRHLSEVSPDNIFPEAINLRYKEKYWDYTYVCINYKDGQTYKELTIDDPYFNLFNIGYSLRECWHNCPYTTTHRYSDITLADFWGYKAHSYKMSDFLKGTSLVLINSDKGEKLFEMIKDKLVCEESNLIVAKSGNKSLSEPFQLDETSKLDFWKDYENGMSVVELNAKYTKGKFTLPKLLRLKRMKKKIEWVWMHE